MANIPGISGYVQPGTFARDRVVSRGVSIPGGLRVLSIMGLGVTSLTLVDGALGSGQDGNETPSGADKNGRFFRIPEAPLIAGRTRVFVDGSELTLYEGSFGASDSVQAGFDCQVDIETGELGLSGASFLDQDGALFSASASNVGTGTIAVGQIGDLNELEILDDSTPAETWTLRCVSVTKDGSGNNEKGKARFTLTGSESGQLKDSNGNAFVFTDTFKTGTDGNVYQNDDLTMTGEDGYLLMDGGTGRDSEFGAFLLATSVSETSTKYVAIPLDASAAASGNDLTADFVDRLQVGDFFVTRAGGIDPVDTAHKIVKINKIVQNDIRSATNHGNAGYLVLELETAIESDTLFAFSPCDVNLDTSSSSIGIDFSHYNFGAVNELFRIVATNAFVADSAVDQFDSIDLGKLLLIDGSYEDRYVVTAITAGRNIGGAIDSVLRVKRYSDDSDGFGVLTGSETVNWSLVETNDVLTIGIDGLTTTTAFSVGDRFIFKIDSNTLKKDSILDVQYISELNINDPQYFIDANELFGKHGFGSAENTLSLGAQLAFENGAPGILATQCKPSAARKTEVTLIEERDANGKGGIAVGADFDEDDLTFTIPTVKTGGYRLGAPDSDTEVSIIRIRNGVETQIFPNKSSFYNSAQDDSSGKQGFVDSTSTFAFSYTIANSNEEEYGNGIDGSISIPGSSTTATFSSSSFDFDSVHVGAKVLIKSLDDNTGTTIQDEADIGNYLDGGSSATFTIASITDDNNVVLSGAFTSGRSATNIRFTIYKASGTANKKVLLLNKSIFTSNSIQNGDGLKIRYIDQNDADFFDTNWFQAFEKLEAFDTQIIVPLPTQTKSNILRAAVAHCETMSTIANRKERVALIGAFAGVTDQALIGNELVAVENIGVIEGIQGDDPEEVLAGNIEDLQNFKLSDNYTSNRAVYFYPDQVVRTINGTNTLIDGYFIAAAAGGRLSATQNVAIPLTNKTLIGFNILRDKVLPQTTLNQLGEVGATVLQPVTGGGRILAGRTTSNSGFIEDEEISIIFIRDRVKQIMRDSLQPFIGTIQDSSTNSIIQARVTTILNALVNQGLIESFTNASVSRDKVDPRQINVYFRFVPTFPINYVFIDIEVGIS